MYYSVCSKPRCNNRPRLTRPRSLRGMQRILDLGREKNVSELLNLFQERCLGVSNEGPFVVNLKGERKLFPYRLVLFAANPSLQYFVRVH